MMSTAVKKLDATQQLIELIENTQSQFEKIILLDTLRANGLKNFSALGIPGRKSEAYKYSNPEKLFKKPFSFFSDVSSKKKPDIEKYLIPSLNADVIVLINGVFSKELSNKFSDKINISSLKEAAKKNPTLIEKYLLKKNNNDVFSSLNDALAGDGLFIYVPENVMLEKPLHIINITDAGDNSFITPFHLFVVEKNSGATIIESQVNVKTSEVLINSQTSLFVAENAAVNYYVIQDDGSANKINAINIYQNAASHVDTCTVTLDANWVRNNLNISLNGKSCETHLNGLFILNAKQHLDNHTMVDHRLPHCESNQLYKGVLSGSSTGVFNGKIFVQRDAQKTNAYQSSKNILLSDDATINAKPELEIYADDVKCSHGSSTGKIDEEALFYLRSRGIGEDSAKTLMLQAFAGDVIEKIKNESLREYLLEAISSKF